MNSQQKGTSQSSPKIITNEQVDRILLQNQQLLWTIAAESNQRKNKNFVNASIATMICQLERNLLKICKNLPPSAIADSQVIMKEKTIFNRLYRKKMTNNGPSAQAPHIVKTHKQVSPVRSEPAESSQPTAISKQQPIKVIEPQHSLNEPTLPNTQSLTVEEPSAHIAAPATINTNNPAQTI